MSNYLENITPKLINHDKDRYQIRVIDSNHVYYEKNKSNGYWEFISKEEFDEKANNKNNIKYMKCKCNKCEWEWVIESEDYHPYLCHKCGFDNKTNKYDLDSLKKWEINNKPYVEERNLNIIKRTFNEDINENELVWHRDREDRIVIPLYENNWMLQLDNELPIRLNVNEEYFITKNTFHRVIKGSGELTVEIIETNFEKDTYGLLGENKKKKDACYYKVKSRYDVWPSAYASGALVQCRKVGAKNWGNKSNENIDFSESKKTDFSKEKSQGLHGWFSRKGGEGSSGWVDCNTCRKDPDTGRKKCKPCGREEGENREYPACRPTPSSCDTKGRGDKWGKKSVKEFKNLPNLIEDGMIGEIISNKFSFNNIPDNILKTLRNEYFKYYIGDFDWNNKQDEFTSNTGYDGRGFKEWCDKYEVEGFFKNLNKLIQKVREDLIVLIKKRNADKVLSDFEELVKPVLGNDVLVGPLSKYMEMALLNLHSIGEINKAFQDAKQIINIDGSLNQSKIEQSKIFNGDYISFPAFEKFVNNNPEFIKVFNDWKKLFDESMKLSSMELNAFRDSTSYESIKDLYDFLINVRTNKTNENSMTNFSITNMIIEELSLINEITTDDAYNQFYKNLFNKENSELDKLTYNTLIQLDPTYLKEKDKVGEYTKWLFRADNLERLKKVKKEDLYKIKDDLTFFNNVKKKNLLPVDKKDINKFNLDSLLDFVFSLNNDNEGELLSKGDKEREVKKGVQKFSLRDWDIIIPGTEEAACYYGKGTKWCTSSTTHNQFDYYNSDGPLYIIINKDDSNLKFQFHFESSQFMDVKDREINLGEFLEDNDDVYDFFKKRIGTGIDFEIVKSCVGNYNEECVTNFISNDFTEDQKYELIKLTFDSDDSGNPYMISTILNSIDYPDLIKNFKKDILWGIESAITNEHDDENHDAMMFIDYLGGFTDENILDIMEVIDFNNLKNVTKFIEIANQYGDTNKVVDFLEDEDIGNLNLNIIKTLEDLKRKFTYTKHTNTLDSGVSRIEIKGLDLINGTIDVEITPKDKNGDLLKGKVERGNVNHKNLVNYLTTPSLFNEGKKINFLNKKNSIFVENIKDYIKNTLKRKLIMEETIKEPKVKPTINPDRVVPKREKIWKPGVSVPVPPKF